MLTNLPALHGPVQAGIRLKTCVDSSNMDHYSISHLCNGQYLHSGIVCCISVLHNNDYMACSDDKNSTIEVMFISRVELLTYARLTVLRY